MPQLLKDKVSSGHRYALCVGIGTYTELTNRDLRYAVVDARAIAQKLADPQWGNFDVTLLIKHTQTTKRVLLDETLERMLNGPRLKAEDLVIIYLSCHGNVYGKGNTWSEPILPDREDSQLLSDDGKSVSNSAGGT